MWKRVRGREGRREGHGWMEWKTVTESVADTERERVEDGGGFEGGIKRADVRWRDRAIVQTHPQARGWEGVERASEGKPRMGSLYRCWEEASKAFLVSYTKARGWIHSKESLACMAAILWLAHPDQSQGAGFRPRNRWLASQPFFGSPTLIQGFGTMGQKVIHVRTLPVRATQASCTRNQSVPRAFTR